MPNKLINLKVERVALVDSPANDEPLLLIKRHEEVAPELDVAINGGNPDLWQALERHFKREEPPVAQEKKPDITALPEDVQQYIKSLEAKQPEPEAIDKSEMPEPMRKRFEELEKRAAEAEALAKQEREKRLTKEYIEKAREFAHLPISQETFGPVLREIEENLTPEASVQLKRVLKSADEIAASSRLFGELGLNGEGDDNSADGELEKRARDYASLHNVSIEAARVRVLENDSDLAKRVQDSDYNYVRRS